MDVAGFPSRENVCSNILAFYLNPAEEHGMGDLLLTSLFRMCGLKKEEFPPTEQVRIQREYGTDERKRIDLVISHPDFTIGIENKIYHWLANDLEHYAGQLTQLTAGSHEPHKIVLGLHPIPGLLSGGFHSHTYRDFWTHVRKGLGPRINSANPKWLTHLIDFMANTENLTGSTFEIKPTDRFFIDHEALIARMTADHNEFLTRLTQRVIELKTLMSESGKSQFLIKDPWIHASRVLVFDLLPGNRESVTLDLCLYPSGWELQIFGRSNSSRHYALGLGDRILGGPPQRTNGGQRCLAASWPLETDLGIIREGVNGWIQKLADAANINEAQPAGAIIEAGSPEL